jgi:hypoxanthine-guanine phosphoribosyltransferase
MRSEYVISEWKECRETIARFDGYLLQIRLLGVSVFTITFTIIAGITWSDGELAKFSNELFVYSLVALLLFVATIYILDRYYERMLLVSVLRASRLESYQLEGFRIGLTTEIEFLKGEFRENNVGRWFFKASTSVNIAYVIMLIFIALEYGIIAHTLEITLYTVAFYAFFFIVVLICVITNSVLNEPNQLIEARSAIVTSPVIYSKAEIEEAINQVAFAIIAWIKAEKIQDLNVVSILSGARQFTESLLKLIEKEKLNIHICIHPIRIKATIGSQVTGNPEIIYGKPSGSKFNEGATLIVDDLLDSGATIKFVRKLVSEISNRPIDDNLIKTAVLINKYEYEKDENEIEIINANFVGLNLSLNRQDLITKKIKDYWLFGFGMDIEGEYREIEHIGWIEQKAD